MTRTEFMKELAYLLQDIQDEEKQDAIQYYNDYFDEAGPDQEEEILRDLGSPERIAAMIRSDLMGSLKEGGEFTESGYRDERFRDPDHWLAKRLDLPKTAEEGWKKADQEPEPSEAKAGGSDATAKPSRGHNKPLTIALWAVILILLSPVLLGIGGGLMGILTGIAGLLIGLLLLLGALAIGGILAGLCLIPFGLVLIFTEGIFTGLLIMGLGMVLLGAGILFGAISIVFYGKLVPNLLRQIIDAVNRLIHKRRKPT